MFAPLDDPEPEQDDWHALLEPLQQLHARLLTTAETLRVDLARPLSTWNVARDPSDDVPVQLGPGRLPETERAALYASVRADIQMLEQLTERLEQLRVTLGRGTPPASSSYG